MFLPDDRARQGVIAPMNVGDNMKTASIGSLSWALGIRSRPEERKFVARSSERFSVKMASPRSSMREAAGGNQQKVLLARALSNEGRLVLLYEPTQGVDVGVKADIYAQLCESGLQGARGAYLFVGRGRVDPHLRPGRGLGQGRDRGRVCLGRNLEGRHYRGDGRLFDPSRPGHHLSRTRGDKRVTSPAINRYRTGDSLASRGWRPSPSAQGTLRVWALALALLIFYFFIVPAVGQLNEHQPPLAELSPARLGGRRADGCPYRWPDRPECWWGGQPGHSDRSDTNGIFGPGRHSGQPCGYLIGATFGVFNGFLVAYRRMSSFIVTIATWSIIDGAALLVLPSAGGSVPTVFTSVVNMISPLSFGTIALIGSLLLWAWARNTAGFLRLRAVGSGAEKAHWAGVAERRTVLAAYAFSGLAAASAGLVLAGVTSSGDPNIGTSYILNSLAAAVIGGVSLLGGSGSFAGVLGGAMVLTMVNNVVFALGLTAYLEPAIVGGILAVAVFTTGIGSHRRLAGGAGT